MPSLPKLSYVLLSHNREKYIRAAVESALAQDYEGELEYIFSDDCSTDRTFEIIKECVAAYKGTRRIVVTQPSENLKTASNFNHALNHVQSNWVVRADDDDISAVDRCSVIGRSIACHPDCTYVATRADKTFGDGEDEEAWEESRKPCGEAMQMKVVDVRANTLEECAFRPSEYSYKAWGMNAIRAFGPIPADAYYADDYILYFRAAVMGEGVLVDNANAVLVRCGGMNQSTGKNDFSSSYQTIMRRERFFDAYQNSTYAPMCQTLRQLREYVQQMPQEEQALVDPFLAHMQGMVENTGILRTYWRRGTINRIRIARRLGCTRLYDMARCLPMPLFALCAAAIGKLIKTA